MHVLRSKSNRDTREAKLLTSTCTYILKSFVSEQGQIVIWKI